MFHTQTEYFNNSTYFTILYTLFHSTSLQMNLNTSDPTSKIIRVERNLTFKFPTQAKSTEMM